MKPRFFVFNTFEHLGKMTFRFYGYVFALRIIVHLYGELTVGFEPGLCCFIVIDNSIAHIGSPCSSPKTLNTRHLTHCSDALKKKVHHLVHT